MPDMHDCTGTCRRSGTCDCGALIGDTLQDGRTVRVGLMLSDSAPQQRRKTLDMMTDSEQRAMRDTVRGMPLHQAVALPIYDNVRNGFAGGRNAAEYYAMVDGAVPSVLGSREPSFENIDAAAHQMVARAGMIDHISNAWRNPDNDNKRG